MADISDWSATAANNNATPPDGAPEGMTPSGVNDTIREIMAAVRRWYVDAQWISLGITHTRISSSSFSISGDYSDTYEVGRRVKMTGSATSYGTVSAVSYVAPDTTVTIAENNVPATLSAVSVGALSASDSALPQTPLTPYTPTITGLVTDPTIGNGAIVGVYSKIGQQVSVSIRVAFGSTSTFGSGTWYVSLPFVPSTSIEFIGSVVMLDLGSAWYTGSVSTTRDGTARMQFFSNNTVSNIRSDIPFTWADGDILYASVTYYTA